MGWKSKSAAGALVLALGLITVWEGYEPTAYLDPVGIPTICYGHTGKDVFLGKQATLDICHDLLSKDVFEVKSALDRMVKVPLKANEEAAFISFTYNVGIENLRKSKLLRLVNEGRIADACHELPRWVFATKRDGSKVKLKGLVNRRQAELKLCLGES